LRRPSEAYSTFYLRSQSTQNASIQGAVQPSRPAFLGRQVNLATSPKDAARARLHQPGQEAYHHLVVALIVIGVIILATVTFRRLRLGKRDALAVKELPYEKVTSLLTPAERDFFETLWAVAQSEDLAVFTKVRLSDLVKVRRGIENRQVLQNRIQQKHVDFVLCSSSQLAPVLVVELDDRSHQLPRRQERDILVDRIFASADLPILRIPVAHHYHAEELAAQIRARLGLVTTARSG